jgi:nucleotide-binding universal stress UspA family protein
MFEKILVPLDGSRNAEMVLPYAEEIAGKFRGELSLVGVVEKDNQPVTSAGVQTNDVLYSYLTEISKKVTESGHEFGIEAAHQVSFKFLSGDIAQKILAYADEINAGLVALTSRGSSSHEKWVLGNIAAKILRATQKPVLLVRTVASEETLNRKHLINNILVPLDGSATGESAIPFAESLAVKLTARLVLIHVLEPLTKAGMYDTNPKYSISDALTAREEEAQRYLQKVGGLIKEKTGITPEIVISMGYPANEIADYAGRKDIDLIAMSTHGRTGIQHWVFGSVTDKTLHFGDTPVLVVRPPKN